MDLFIPLRGPYGGVQKDSYKFQPEISPGLADVHNVENVHVLRCVVQFRPEQMMLALLLHLIICLLWRMEGLVTAGW